MIRNMVTPIMIIASALSPFTLVFSAEAIRKLAGSESELKDVPLTIVASDVGSFGGGIYSWSLSVNSAGQAELTIETRPKRTSKRFDVPKERMDEFRKALIEERFFELEREYGEVVPDGSTQTITVVTGQRIWLVDPHSSTVQIHYLWNWRDDKAKLREPSRAVRLMVMVRGWFVDERAVDHRKWDEMVLAAVKKK
jgi:hypothetical protein